MSGSATSSMYQALVQVLRSRRSIRQFRPEPIADETIRALVEAARHAPSAGNAQPWEFIVVRDETTKRRIGDIYLEQLKQKNRLEMLRSQERRFFGAEPPPLRAGFVQAGALIVVIGDPRLADAYPLRTKIDKGQQHLISSLSNVVVTLHYAAAALGLASQYLSDSGSPEMELYLKDLLGIPEPYRVYETVCIGHTDVKPSSRYVKAFDDIVHQERFDAGRFKTEEQIDAHIKEKLRPAFKKVL